MRIIKITCIFLMMCFIFTPTIFATDSANADDQDDPKSDFNRQYQELLEQSGANELFSIIPDESKQLMIENDITSLDVTKLVNINFFDFMGSIWETVKSVVTKPLTILLTSVGIILLCALLNSLKSGFNNASYERVFSVVSVVCIAGTIIVPIAETITKTANVISQVSKFILSFIPVYVGIITASGKPISGVAYSTSLVGMVQVISYITGTVLVPLLSIYLAFCLIGSTSVNINVDGIARGVKTSVIVVLSFLLTMFIGVLSIQGVIAGASDTMSLKAAKFALSAFLPVVGGAIGDALNSVQGGMGVIRSTVGAFGIIAVVTAFLPSIISVLLMQLSLSISGAISDMFDTDRITALIRSASLVLSLILGILLLFFVLLVLSITIMLSMTSGT